MADDGAVIDGDGLVASGQRIMPVRDVVMAMDCLAGVMSGGGSGKKKKMMQAARRIGTLVVGMSGSHGRWRESSRL